MNDSRQALGNHPEQGQQPEESSTPIPHPTRLAIRLWTPIPFNFKWSSEFAVIYLMADLIDASQGSLVENGEPGLIAHFEHSGQAYKAAKRLQWALIEFCQQRPDQCLSAAAVLYDASDPAGGRLESDSRQRSFLLDASRPGQILATGTTSHHLRELPGLQFRTPTALPQARHEWQGGAQEVIWTATSNLDQLQQKLKITAQTLAQKPEQVRASEQPTVDFSHSAGHRSAPTLIDHESSLLNHEPPSFPQAGPAEPDARSELLEQDPYTDSSGGRYLWWSVAIVMVLAIAGFLVIPKLRTKPAVADSPAVTPVVQQQESPPIAEPPVAAPPTVSPPVSEGKAPDRAKVTAPPQPEKTTHSQPRKLAEFAGMSEKDIPVLLRMAEKDAGAGNYEDARREFDIVLHLDPGNAEAKQGMRKLELSEREAR